MAAEQHPVEKGSYHVPSESAEEPQISGQRQQQRQRRLPSVAVRVALLAGFALLLMFSHVRDTTRSMLSGCHLGQKTPPLSELSIEDRVDRILSATPLVDGHNDFAIFIRYAYHNHIYGKDFRQAFEKDGLAQHVDLPRLRAGKNGGAFWSVYVGCPANGSDYSDGNYAQSVQETLEQIDLVNRLKALYPDVFSASANSSAALAAFGRGQLISPLGVEGLHQIGNRAGNLRAFHALGVRYATLTHNCGNRYADAALWESPLRKASPVWGGLSRDGRRLVREMNRLGVIVDLSHTSVDTMEDVLGGRPDGDWTGSVAPVIYSHSSAYSLCPHPRNVPDHVLDLVQARGGLVMVNFAPDFVSCRWDDESRARDNGIPSFYPPNSTLAHVASHVLHIGRRIGFAHVGFGSDFDGIASTPRGLEDVSTYPALVAELLRRGVTDDEAALVAGGNLLRVWREVEETAQRLQAAGEPILEDDVQNVPW